MFEKLKAYLESDEGQKSIDEFHITIQKRDEYNKRWVNRINDYLETLTDKEFTKLMSKFLKWETKYDDMWYYRGVLTYSNILTSLFNVAETYGTEIEGYEDFLAARHEYVGYVFSLYLGQGSIIGITNKGKRIF